MKKNLEASVARSLEMSKSMLPFVPDLLKGMWALGGSPELVVELLRPLNLPESSTRVLDLGCGKGAVSVKVAAELGFQVVGIDACKAFLDEASAKAAEYAVASLCRFQLQDLRDYVKTARDFDVVILASVGGVLGRLDSTIKILGSVLKPGGYMILDEGFFTTKKIPRAGYEHIVPHAETLRHLTSHGDRLIKEILNEEETHRTNELYLEIIKKNAADLILCEPTLKKKVEAYIRLQEEECRFLDRHFTGAIWLLRHGDDRRP
jgi:SAM-dependent methyltransferase